MKTQSPQFSGRAGRGRLARWSARIATASATTLSRMTTAMMAMKMPISVRPLRPYPPYQEVVMTNVRVALFALAVLLAACGGAGSGGTIAPTTSSRTAAPAGAGTEPPKQYAPGKTADPSASPDGDYGY